MVYTLRLFDDDLMDFTLDETEFEGLKANIIDINNKKIDLFPLDMSRTNDGVVHWLKRRVIPKNRMFVENILSSLNLNSSQTKSIIDVCMGLSLNDSYWVVHKGFEGKFADYNLYENRFSKALSLVAFTGYSDDNVKLTTTPELTTNGALRKAWRFIPNEGVYLYKGGSFGAVNTGNEPFNEYYAAQVAEAMGLDYVPYELVHWKGILASRCKLFTNVNTSYVPIGRFLPEVNILKCLKYYRELGESFFEPLCSMIVFDCVVCNEDRHFGNFGVLRDSHSGKIIAPAPIFDNGLSLFNYGMPNNFKDLKSYVKTRSNPYDIRYESLCKLIMGRTQKKQLQRLNRFTFTRHPKIEWSEARLVPLENYIRDKASELLNIPVPKDRFLNLELENKNVNKPISAHENVDEDD